MKNISAHNSVWKCPTETSRQNNIWPESCEFSQKKDSRTSTVPIYDLWDIELTH